MSHGLALTSKPLLFLFATAVADGMLHSSIVWTTLLFLTHIGYSNPAVDPSLSFFVFISGLCSLTPVLATTPLSMLASSRKFGSVYALSLGNIIISVACLLYTVSRFSRLIYCIATVGFAFIWAVRLVRVSLAVRLVNRRDSTMAAALHQNCFSSGFILGPLLWFSVQLWRGSIYINDSIILDRFTLLFLVNSIVCGVIAAVNPLVLGGVEEAHAQASDTSVEDEGPPGEESSLKNSTSEGGETKSSYGAAFTMKMQGKTKDKILVRNSLMFFGACMFLYRMCSGIVMTSNQAVVVNIFQLKDSQVSMASFCEAILSCLLVSIMSRLTHVLKIQQVATVTLFAHLSGLLLFLPIFPTFTLVQGLGGFVLVKVATLTFAGVCVSMLSQTLGPMYKHYYGGYIWTIGMMGMSAAQFALTPYIVPFIATWKYSLFIIPNLIVFVLMMPAVRNFILTP